jgi:hypothetical protein
VGCQAGCGSSMVFMRVATQARPALVFRPSDRRSFSEQVNESLVRSACFGREARRYIAEIRGVERSTCIDLARRETCSERTEGNEADAKLFTCCQHAILFDISRPQGVLASFVLRGSCQKSALE